MGGVGTVVVVCCACVCVKCMSIMRPCIHVYYAYELYCVCGESVCACVCARPFLVRVATLRYMYMYICKQLECNTP
jgi:hypothetical protein